MVLKKEQIRREKLFVAQVRARHKLEAVLLTRASPLARTLVFLGGRG